ncbi:MAG: autotransporter outer membrane beta-barrel domain-containing protein, partial [Synergistaceae bacterium]|nr:autotransporter outer membrane beta-barrel domain-containing protein [Synergistaceae bacterium]
GVDGETDASGNTLLLVDADISTYVFGGQSITPTGNATATNNAITLTGTTSVGTHLFGGVDASGGAGTASSNNATSGSAASDYFTGNKLNIKLPDTDVDPAGINVGGNLGNFEEYSFILHPEYKFGLNGEGPAVSVGGKVYLGNSYTTGTKGSDVTDIHFLGGGYASSVGDEFTLIHTTAAGDMYGFLSDSTSTGKKGATLFYDYTVAVDTPAQNLVAAVSNVRLNPQDKALSEGWLSGLAFELYGADLVADELKTISSREYERNSYTFGTLSYNKLKHDTGSHIDVDGVSALAGVAKTRVTKRDNRMTLGGFIEAGWGDYDSYNSFSNAPSVRGHGDTNYYGGGLALRVDFKDRVPRDGDENKKGHLYTDAAIRVGKAEADFATADMTDILGTAVNYESDTMYYGAHVSLGYLKKLSAKSELDIYTRLLWTRQEGDDVVLSTNDPVSFDDADSFRWRTGLRYSSEMSGKYSFYLGAAYEHEFDGEVDATTYQYGTIPSPSMKGGTGIGELGVAYMDKANTNFRMDLGVSGYTGQREGFGVKLDLDWFF